VRVADAPTDRSPFDDSDSTPVIVSPRMQHLHELVRRAATTDAPVLVLGETGVGKELVASALHYGSPRRTNRLIVVNCGALPATLTESSLFGYERGAYTGADRRTKGVFEQADAGTVFLDEIGELSPSSQAALLRILENKRFTRLGSAQEVSVDVRVVAATNRDIESMVASGKFRADLYYRLSTLTLLVPPLRERREEIRPLCDLFLRRASRAWDAPVRKIHDAALERLQRYAWPGNVRELKNVIERAVIVSACEDLLIEHLPENVRGPERQCERAFSATIDLSQPYRERIKSFEAAVLREALEKTDGSRTEAARLLRIPLRTMMRKLEMLGVR
jgi:transcriptional regulator with PAS, ATPase and Fis domain